MLVPHVAFSGDDLVLQFAADGHEVRVVAGDADEQVAVVLRMGLCFSQDIRVEDVDLQGRSAILDVAEKEGLELFFVGGIADQRCIEGDGVRRAVRQVVDILGPVAASGDLAAEGFADGVDVRGRAVDVRAVGRADRVAQELRVRAAVGGRLHDVGGADPVVPGQHARTEPSVGGLRLILPGLVRPEFHDLAGELIGFVVITAVLRVSQCMTSLSSFIV